MKQFIHSQPAHLDHWPQSKIGGNVDNSIDHPERMLFYATLFGLVSWTVIGLISWGVWHLLS